MATPAPKSAPCGWDVAGVVEESAADGSGPPAGTRVAGLVKRGAWAQLAAVPTEIGGLILGKRVLITGASGGVGRFAIQLAHAAGADVSALVRDVPATSESLHRLGATTVAGQIEGPFDLIIDCVGGEVFGESIENLATRGVVVNIATQWPEQTITFEAGRFDRSPGARIYTLNMPDELTAHSSGTRDLGRLCALVAAGRLDRQVELEHSWREPAPAIEALLNRRIHGKVVLHVD